MIHDARLQQAAQVALTGAIWTSGTTITIGGVTVHYYVVPNAIDTQGVGADQMALVMQFSTVPVPNGIAANLVGLAVTVIASPSPTDPFIAGSRVIWSNGGHPTIFGTTCDNYTTAPFARVPLPGIAVSRIMPRYLHIVLAAPALSTTAFTAGVLNTFAVHADASLGWFGWPNGQT